MKKINKAMLFTMTLMMIVVCMCFGAGAVSDVIVDSGECGAEGDNVTWVLYDDGELVISGEGEMADYGFMNDSPFHDSDIKSVVIEDGVTSIGDTMFSDCDSLTDVVIPDSVTSVGCDVFRNCYLLKNIAIPDGATKIDDGTFFGCYSLTDVVIPDKVTSIGIYAFGCCTNLTNIIIPDNVITIDRDAFDRCTAATSIIIGKSVRDIGTGAFKGCESVEKVYIPESVMSIGSQTFSACNNLKEIEVDENNINYVSEHGVLFNKNKTELVRYPALKEGNIYSVPESVTSFGDEAFGDCKNIEEIVLGGNVISLSNWLFQDCSNLKKIEFLGNLTTINMGAFWGCENLIDITIPASVTSIESDAFRSCNSLKLINIPVNVANIGEEAFGYCDNLENIFVDEQNSDYCDINGVLYNKDKSVLVQYPDEKKNLTYILDENAAIIESYAFGYNPYLENVVFSKSIREIKSDAFFSCNKFKRIYYAGTLENWDEVLIGEKNDSIRNAIIYCNCEYVDIDGNGICDICDEEKGIVARGECGAEGDNVTWVLYSNGELVISGEGDIANFVNGSPFKNLDFEEVFIEEGIESIGHGTFAYCKDLSNVMLPSSLVSIGDYVFQNCTNIIDVVIPNSVISIGEGAFYFCLKLENIKLSNNITSLGHGAFYNCYNLVNLEIPDSVTSIGAYALYSCSNIESIILPDTVMNIGEGAFDYCTNLKDVYYDGIKKQWNSIVIGTENSSLLNATIHFLGEIAYLEENFEITFENGVLSISGSGEIPSFEDVTDYPWNKYASSTTDLVIRGVTSVGKNAFAGFSNLKSVIIDGRSDEGVCDVVVESESFADCENLSLVVSYANINFYDDAITGNKTPIKYFNNAYVQNYSNIEFIPFSFEEEVIKETIEDETGTYEIVIETFKTVVNGEVSFNEDGFKRFISALYYFSDNNFVNVVFNKLTAEDFYIYEYTSLSPLQGKEITEVSAAKIFAIIETWPGDGEYMSLAMEDFCDFIASDEFNGHDYKFAVLGKAEEPEEDDDKEIPEDEEKQEDEEYQEEEPNFIVKVFATIFEAIKKIFVLLKNLF